MNACGDEWYFAKTELIIVIEAAFNIVAPKHYKHTTVI